MKQSIKMDTTIGAEVSFHIVDGEIIIDHSNLNEEETAKVIAAFPSWAIERKKYGKNSRHRCYNP